MPAASAMRTANPVGLEIAARIGTPNTAAFWTSSKLARLVTTTNPPPAGMPARAKAPTILVQRVVATDSRHTFTGRNVSR